MRLLFLLLFCHVSSPVKHSLKYFVTASSGLPNFPEFVSAVVVDDVLVGYCDSVRKTPEPKQDWVINLFKNEPQQLELYTEECVENGPYYFKATIDTLNQRFNQSGGINILQRMSGCEWDDESGEVNGFNQYSYGGEDLLAFDLKTLTWIAPRTQAVATKLRWDADKGRTKHNKIYLTEIMPALLKNFLAYGKSSLLRRELPSVSLLQKTSSSPVTCFATGFYPDRAALVWRKDGVELHEDVDHGEILPNHDGTFQMSADLKLSSVAPEDWKKYECVFQLSGAEDKVTRLEKSVIQTNEEKHSNMTFLITAAMAVLAVFLITAASFIIYKRKRATCPPSTPDNSSELSEKLNSAT